MNLIDLQNKANEGYPDGFLANSFTPETGKATAWRNGDILAWFIAVELEESFNPEASEKEQVEEAVRVCRSAIGDLEKVISSITKGAEQWRYCGELQHYGDEGSASCPYRSEEFSCIGCPHFRDTRVLQGA